MVIDPFTDEQARALVNLEQRYEVWMAAERSLRALPYDLRWKEVDGRAYLYEVHDRGGNGHSLGPWTAENEARFEAYRQSKAERKSRRGLSRDALAESGRLCRALRVPMLLDAVAQVMPQYPLDIEFERALPEALAEPFALWRARGVGPARPA